MSSQDRCGQIGTRLGSYPSVWPISYRHDGKQDDGQVEQRGRYCKPGSRCAIMNICRTILGTALYNNLRQRRAPMRTPRSWLRGPRDLNLQRQ